MSTAQQVIDLAHSFVGTKEKPANSNRTDFGAWFGMNPAPWCSIFLSFVFARAGMSLTTGKGTASTDAALAWYRRQGRFSDKPQVGALVFYGTKGNAFHVGLIYDFDSRYVYTVEGNTSSSGGSQINGGEVALKKRLRTASGPMPVIGYGLPAYGESSTATQPPVSPAPASPVAPQEDDDMSAELTITYPNGTKTIGTPDGGIFNAGTPHFGSMYSLKANEKQGVSSIKALTPVNANDSGAGYIAWSDKGAQYRFDQAFVTNHGI